MQHLREGVADRSVLGAVLHHADRAADRPAVKDLDHALTRGELRADIDVGLAADLLFGPLYQRLLITGEPVTPRVADKLADLFLRAVSAS